MNQFIECVSYPSMSMISDSVTSRMTCHVIESKRRKYQTIRWVVTLISIFGKCSIASKPKVTLVDYSRSHDDDLSMHKRIRKRWGAFERYDFPDSSQCQRTLNEQGNYSMESSNDPSDTEDDLDLQNVRGYFHRTQRFDVTSSVRRYQQLNDDILNSETNNRPLKHSTHGAHPRQIKQTTPQILHNMHDIDDHSQVRSFHDDTDVNVENRQIQRLLRLPCSLSLRHDAITNPVRTSVCETRSRVPVSTYIDTGATHTVLTYGAAMRAGIAHLIDSRYAGHATGVAGVSCRVLGRIPSNTVSFIFHLGDGKSVSLEQSPVIMILEDISNLDQSEDKVDMLIGLDLLEEWEATISLRSRDLRVRQRSMSRHYVPPRGVDDEIIIPFISERNHDILQNVLDSNVNHHGDTGHDESRIGSAFIGSKDPTLIAYHQHKVMNAVDRNMYVYDSNLEDTRKGLLTRKDISTLSQKIEVDDRDEVSDGYSDDGEYDDVNCDMSGV